MPVFDHRQALSRCGEDAALLLEIIDIFQDSHAAALDELRDAASQDDRPRLRRVAHTLKGTADTLGGLSVHPLAAKVESLAQAEGTPDWETLLSELSFEVQQLSKELRCFSESALAPTGL
jgi:HPt (histidine-containing phosphotransfer) domain-containing protein